MELYFGDFLHVRESQLLPSESSQSGGEGAGEKMKLEREEPKVQRKCGGESEEKNTGLRAK